MFLRGSRPSQKVGGPCPHIIPSIRIRGKDTESARRSAVGSLVRGGTQMDLGLMRSPDRDTGSWFEGPSSNVTWRTVVASASLLLLLIVGTGRFQSAGLLAAPVVDVWLEAGAQPMAETNGPVRYNVTVSNAGFASATDVVVTHTLPAGFSYRFGSTRVILGGELMSTTDPQIGGSSLAWGPFTVPAGWGVFDNPYGVHTFAQDLCAEGYIDFQLDKALDLVGVGGHVTQLIYPVTPYTQVPSPCWVYFVSAAYDRGLTPIVRLQGRWGGDFWIKPQPDSPGDYSSIAHAYRRVVQGLPRRDGSTLYVQIWNEPDLALEWSGEPSAEEYGHFFVDVAQAIHSIGDPRVKVLNGALTPGNVSFTRGLTNVPGFAQSFDLWASHCYPLNHPPSYNIHDGTARYPQYTIDCYLLELRALRDYGGRRNVRVLLTETGYGLYDRTFRFEGYPTITEDNRAYYMKRAFRDFWVSWPEVVGATPFELVDPYDSWPRWDWLYPGTDVPHRQYSVVRALVKPEPLEIHPSQLIISFTASASDTPGTYRSNVSATSADTTVVPLTGVAPVTVVDTLYTRRFPLSGVAERSLGGGLMTGVEAEWGARVEEVLERIDLTAWEEEPWRRVPASHLDGPAEAGEPLRLVQRVPMGLDPLAIALDTVRHRAYVTLAEGLLVTLDLEDPRVLCTVPVGTSPGVLAVNEATGAVYVANQGEGTVSQVQGAGCGPVQTIAVGAEVSGLAADEAANLLYASDAHAGAVVAVDVESRREVGRVNVGDYPEALALDQERGVLLVASAGDGTLLVVDLDGLNVLDTVQISQGPLLDLSVDRAGGRIYVLHLGAPPRRQVTVVDVETREVMASLSGGWEHPLLDAYEMALDEARGVVYLVDRQQLLAVEAGTLGLISATPVDALVDCSGMAVDEQSGNIYVVDSLRGDLLILGR